MHKAFVTVVTGQCLSVFGSCFTNMAAGGACVLCNLSPIVFTSKLSVGNLSTGCNYVVIQCYLVNHLPFLSYITLRLDLAGKESSGREEQIFQKRTIDCCDLVLALAVFCILGEWDHHGPWSIPHLCSSSPHKQQQQHHIIKNNIFNSLSQSEHFISCKETFWQLPP